MTKIEDGLRKADEPGENDVPDKGVIIDESESNATIADERYSTRGLLADPASDISEMVSVGLAKKDVLILVVDDQADNVALLSYDLQLQGYRVVTASNGVEAIKVAFLMRPSLILMDISMPELDGLAATSKIR